MYTFDGFLPHKSLSVVIFEIDNRVVSIFQYACWFSLLLSLNNLKFLITVTFDENVRGSGDFTILENEIIGYEEVYYC